MPGSRFFSGTVLIPRKLMGLDPTQNLPSCADTCEVTPWGPATMAGDALSRTGPPGPEARRPASWDSIAAVPRATTANRTTGRRRGCLGWMALVIFGTSWSRLGEGQPGHLSQRGRVQFDLVDAGRQPPGHDPGDARRAGGGDHP